MSQAPHEQFLEWTYKYHHGRGLAFEFTHRFTGILFCVIVLAAIIIVFLTGPPQADYSPNRHTYVRFGIIISLVVVMLICWLVNGSLTPSRKLRINRQMITLTDTGGLWGQKEYRMSTAGAKFSAVHLTFFERTFALDIFRQNSVYHVKITRHNQTFFFPCNDEREQSQIIKQIKEFLSQ